MYVYLFSLYSTPRRAWSRDYRRHRQYRPGLSDGRPGTGDNRAPAVTRPPDWVRRLHVDAGARKEVTGVYAVGNGEAVL